MVNSNTSSKIIFSGDFLEDLTRIIHQNAARKIFLTTETVVEKLWVSKIDPILNGFNVKKIVLPAGEANKKIDSVIQIWRFLSENGADRRSLLINIGGGMLTDLAGFAASTFKRGIEFVNIPTTLLAQVDASVGGKTGINFNGLKNEVGTFQEASTIIIDTNFIRTLDSENILSGFAEMIKHGLIRSPDHLMELKNYDLKKLDFDLLGEIIKHSVAVKEYFIANDPTEKNIRKALNFGHTVGHAIESLAMEQKRPVLHGYAVAFGMVAELYLSEKLCGFPTGTLHEMSAWIREIYGKFNLTGNDPERIYQLMIHDKKNESGRINFTLVSDIGKIAINQVCPREMVFDSLNFFLYS